MRFSRIISESREGGYCERDIRTGSQHKIKEFSEELAIRYFRHFLFFFFCFGALIFCWLCVLLHCCALCRCVGEIVEDLVNISSLGKKVRTVLESLESNSKRVVYFFVFSYLKFLS